MRGAIRQDRPPFLLIFVNILLFWKGNDSKQWRNAVILRAKAPKSKKGIQQKG